MYIIVFLALVGLIFEFALIPYSRDAANWTVDTTRASAVAYDMVNTHASIVRQVQEEVAAGRSYSLTATDQSFAETAVRNQYGVFRPRGTSPGVDAVHFIVTGADGSQYLVSEWLAGGSSAFSSGMLMGAISELTNNYTLTGQFDQSTGRLTNSAQANIYYVGRDPTDGSTNNTLEPIDLSQRHSIALDSGLSSAIDDDSVVIITNLGT